MFSKLFDRVTSITQLLGLLYQGRRRIYQLVLILLPCCFFYATLPAHAAALHPALPVEQEISPENPDQQNPDRIHETQIGQSAVYISEFMASNGDTLADADGDFSDWLELYNNDSAEVDLTGWYLTDDHTNLTKWQLPVTILAPDEYLVVFASNKDRAVAGAELHTNFKLTSAGEYLALVQPDGTTVASAYSPSYPAQFRDLSYGLDAALNERYFSAPTPGAANGSGLADLAPAITAANHTPTLPSDGDEITVVVTVTPGISPLSQVTLHYRVMFSDTFTTTMLDDGTHGDGAANDGVYGASIPAGVATSGEMVRYYITAQDSESRSSRFPFFQDPTGSAEYLGTVIADSMITTQLPVLQWFISDTLAAETRTGTRASLFYDGAFYDNVFVRLRGGFSTSFPKKSFKIEFNQGEYFKFSPDEEAVDEFNLNTTYSDQAYIRPVLAFESYRDAGSIYSISFPMRVHRNASFYSVALFVEQPDSTYLRRQGLDENGALYKASWNVLDVVNNRIEKKRPKNNDKSDLQALIDGIHLTGDERTAYLFDHLNLPAAINYLATAFIMQDWDTIPRNYYLYRDTEGTGEWMLLPWDKDLTFGNTVAPNHSTYGHPLFGSSDYPATYGDSPYWNHLTDALYDTPVIQQMYLRRLRTLMDQLLQVEGTPANQLYYEARLAQLLAQMETDAEEDRAIWGSYWGSNQSFSSELFEIERGYLRLRRRHLYNTHGPSGSGLIPEQQANNLTIHFGPYEIAPTSGNQNEEYFTLVNPNQVAVDLSGWQIRFADQTEYTFQVGVVIPAQGTLYVTPDVHAFRQRNSSPTGGEALFVQGNYTARLADIGGPLALYNTNAQLVATQNVGNSQLADKLIISELNYHPPSSTRRRFDHLEHLEQQMADGDDYEFIEVKNIDSNAIDLSGLSFTQGISYTFPANTTLAPNALFLLVRNASEFANRYPTITSDGVYTGTLANEGERLTLVDTDGYIVTSFEYGNHSFWPQSANGQGHTLTRRTPAGLGSNPCRWLASHDIYGSPGIDENEDQAASCQPADGEKIIVSELHYNPLDEGATHGDEFEFIELKNIYTMTVGLGEFTFTDGVEYTFPATMTVEPNEFILLVKNQAHFMSRYPTVSVDGVYDKNFSNGGESVALTDDTGSVVISFEYDDKTPWPEAPDGDGYTLIRQDITADINNPCSWRASTNLHGSPKADDSASDSITCARATAERLIVSELNYHPADEGEIDGDEFEFIEFYNAYTTTLNLADISFTAGISYTFPATMTVEPNEFILLAHSPTNFAIRYPAVSVDGNYSRNFANSGESVELSDDTGAVIISFEYDDNAPWPEASDGQGYTLIHQDLTAHINNPCSWRASSNLHGSPKADDPPSQNSTCATPTTERLRVSELNYHPADEGEIDGDEFEFIELYNPYTTTLNLADVAFTEGIRYTFPVSAAIGADQYLLLVRNATEFATRYPNVSVDGVYNNDFSNTGELVELTDDSGSLLISFEYDENAPWPETTDGEGYTLIHQDMTVDINNPCSWRASTNLHGSPKADDPANDSPICASVTAERLIVSELNYHPKGADEGATDGNEFEFIELYNPYTTTLNLTDVAFTEGISYTFPVSAAIGADQYLLLVRNATEFATRYPNVSVNHSYEGEFANTGEQITLLDQDAQPIFSFTYRAQYPWPEEAASAGYTLTRYNVESNPADPNEGCSWRASSDLHGSPGTADLLANEADCALLYLPLLLFN